MTPDEIADFFSHLPSEKTRAYELMLTNFALANMSNIEFFYDLLDNDDEKISYAAFYALHIIHRRLKNYDKLDTLINSNHDRFMHHVTFDHLVSLFYIESDMLFDYDQLLNSTYKDTLYFDDNAGFIHLFADAFATIMENGTFHNRENFIQRWLPKALAAVEQAIALDPEYAKYYCTKARILSIEGKSFDAETNIAKAISIESSDRDDYFLRISTYQFHKAMIRSERRIQELLANINPSEATKNGIAATCSVKPYKGDDEYVFVSYSHLDSVDVYQTISRLQELGINVWFDKGGISASCEYAETIGSKIEAAKHVLIMISHNSVNSEFVRKELQMTFDCNKKPICIFLEQTELSPGMKLQIGIYQHIYRTGLNETEFIECIREAII